MKMTKKEAIQNYFPDAEITVDEDHPDENGNYETFFIDGDEYLVLTDKQADERVAEEIRNSVWAFNSDFLRHYVDLPADLIETIQQRLYEDSNEVFIKLIEAGVGMTQFIEDAVTNDGRGISLALYDHDEIELGNGYYAYRQN